MKTNSPETFLSALKHTTKCLFNNGVLMAEASRSEPRNSKREYILRYSHLHGKEWVSFATCVSPYLKDLCDDFKTTLNIYSC